MNSTSCVEIQDANGNPVLVSGGVDKQTGRVYIFSARVLTPHGSIDVDDEQMILIRHQYQDKLFEAFLSQGA